MKKRKIFIGDLRIGKEEKKAVNEILDSGRISEGKKVREFENEWAKFIGTEHSIAVSSGTAALYCGLEALKHYKRDIVKQGSKVITSPVTYIATTNALVKKGFKPVYVDIDPETFSILPEQIEKLLEKDPKGYSMILPVHLMGYPCDMDEINRIAKKYNLIVFEDSAQAHGSKYKGKNCGSLGLLADFSFYIAHNIQAGELGAVTSNDYEIIRLIKKIKANGRMCDCRVCTRNTEAGCPKIKAYQGDDDFDPRFTHDMTGLNFKTMEFQAAIGLCQLKKAEWIIKKRQENVKFLNENLKKYSHILQLPKFSKNVSYLGYPIVIKPNAGITRKEIRKKLEENGVETRPLFGCIPTQQPVYSFLKKKYEGKLPNAEYIGLNAFYIGCHQYIKKSDLKYIVRVFENILK